MVSANYLYICIAFAFLNAVLVHSQAVRRANVLMHETDLILRRELSVSTSNKKPAELFSATRNTGEISYHEDHKKSTTKTGDKKDSKDEADSTDEKIDKVVSDAFQTLNITNNNVIEKAMAELLKELETKKEENTKSEKAREVKDKKDEADGTEKSKGNDKSVSSNTGTVHFGNTEPVTEAPIAITGNSDVKHTLEKKHSILAWNSPFVFAIIVLLMIAFYFIRKSMTSSEQYTRLSQNSDIDLDQGGYPPEGFNTKNVNSVWKA